MGRQLRVVDDPDVGALAEAFARATFKRSLAQVLSDDEREVLGLLADGFSVEEVGVELMLGQGEVGTHLEHIRKKLRARTRAHAVGIALRGGLLEA
jgi:DNA-binding CsgD family transcriptional regulator